MLLFLPYRRERSHLSASDAQGKPLPLMSGRLGFFDCSRCSIQYSDGVFSFPLRDRLKATRDAGYGTGKNPAGQTGDLAGGTCFT
jgi:hypothetical protein